MDKNFDKCATALLITKSNFLSMFSALEFKVVTLISFSLDFTLFTTLIFFSIESFKIKEHLGKMIAKGIPGKPPPVPTSNNFVLSVKEINFAMERECNT